MKKKRIIMFSQFINEYENFSRYFKLFLIIHDLITRKLL